MRKTLSIIGAGTVGTTLALLAARSGEYQVFLGAKQPKGVLPLGEKNVVVVAAEKAVENADIVLLTVADRHIQSVCEQLASSFANNATVAHCSGALSSDVLQAAKNQGCAVASIHPLQTFPNVESALQKLAGTYCYCEGDKAALDKLLPLVSILQMEAVEISAENKPLYHAAAVMACNYLTALMDASLQLGEAANVPRDTMWKSLQPLVTATITNINEQGCDKALTGPVARGDALTIQQHLQAMASASLPKTVDESYRALGKQALRLTGEENQAALKDIFN